MTVAIQLFDINDRERMTDECPTCGGAEFYDAMKGEPCPECDGNADFILDRNLEPLRFMEIQARVSSLTLRVKELETEATIIETHAEEMARRAKARRNTIARLKQWMLLEMQAAGTAKVKGPFGTAWVQTSPPSIGIEDEESVPRRFKLATITKPYSQCTPEDMEYVKHIDVMKSWIHDDVKATNEVPPGVVYQDDNVHLRIR
jgi:predicted nucleic-acid-binding Zn-ribbon protein